MTSRDIFFCSLYWRIYSDQNETYSCTAVKLVVCTSALFEIVLFPLQRATSVQCTPRQNILMSHYWLAHCCLCLFFFVSIFFFTHFFLFFFYNPIIQEIWSITSTTRTEFELLMFTDTFRFCSYIGNACKQELFNICEIKWLHGVILL